MNEKFIIKPLTGPKALARLRPRPEYFFSVYGAAPVLNVTDVREVVIWAQNGSSGYTLNIWGHVDSDNISEKALIKALNVSDKKVAYSLNTQWCSKIEVTSPDSPDIEMAPIIFEDYIKRAVPDPIVASSDLSLSVPSAGAVKAQSDLTGAINYTATIFPHVDAQSNVPGLSIGGIRACSGSVSAQAQASMNPVVRFFISPKTVSGSSQASVDVGVIRGLEGNVSGSSSAVNTSISIV